MELAAAQIKTLAQSADKAGHQEILNTLSKLQSELEDSMGTLMRLSNCRKNTANVVVEYTYRNVSLFQTLDKPKSQEIHTYDPVSYASIIIMVPT
ncbi:hypothetical protein DPV78_011555 [Talaromyces pinophilus]|jgi:hypothetical protein|nr:hypothetical protein DPV78_011555 [Talaromyces pinophilus]